MMFFLYIHLLQQQVCMYPYRFTFVAIVSVSESVSHSSGRYSGTGPLCRTARYLIYRPLTSALSGPNSQLYSLAHEAVA